MKNFTFLFLCASLLNAGLFPQDKNFYNTEVDRGKIRKIVKKLPENLEDERLHYACEDALSEENIEQNFFWTLTCEQDYKIYHTDAYEFIEKYVNNLMSKTERDYELTSAKQQTLTCEDMLVGLNKDTLETIFPRYEGRGQELEDYALDYCVEKYGKSYLN